MISLSVAEIAEAIGAQIIGNDEVVVSSEVETDSRLCRKGSLFVAKPGEITDGHLFIGNAIDNGAVAAIVEKD